MINSIFHWYLTGIRKYAAMLRTQNSGNQMEVKLISLSGLAVDKIYEFTYVFEADYFLC